MIRSLRRSRVEYDAATVALLGAITVAPSMNHVIVIDNTIKRLKAAGLWDKIIGFYAASHTQQATLLNWKTLRTASVVGTVNFTPFRGMASVGETSRVQCNEIEFNNPEIWNPTDSHAFAYTTVKNGDVASSRIMQSTSGTGTVDMRYTNTSGGSVIQVGSTSAVATQLPNGAPAVGSICACRNNATTIRKHANGIPFGIDYAEAVNASPAGTLTWAGSSAVSNIDTQGIASVGKYLTDSEATTLHNITTYYLTSIAQFT